MKRFYGHRGFQRYTPGFDDESLRDSKEKEELQSDNIPKFNELMSHFYRGPITLDEQGEPIIYPLTEAIQNRTMQELYGVILDYFIHKENGEDIAIVLYTQETQKALANTLELFGLEIQNKYKIENSFEADYIYPQFTIQNIKKLNNFLMKINILNEETEENINTIIFNIYKILKQIGDEERNIDNELDILQGIKDFYWIIEDLGLRSNPENKDMQDYFIAATDGFIFEYKKCMQAGFKTRLYTEELWTPTFLEELVFLKENIGEDMYMKKLEKAYQDIKRGLDLLESMKDKVVIYYSAITEIKESMKEIARITKRLQIFKNNKQKLLTKQIGKKIAPLENIINTYLQELQSKQDINTQSQHEDTDNEVD